MEGFDKRKASGEKTNTDWRSLFAVAVDQALTFFPPRIENGKTIIAPPRAIFEEGEHFWRNAIVAQFIGKIPNFGAFQKMVNILWGEDGNVDIRPVGTNLFIIQFPNAEMRDKLSNVPLELFTQKGINYIASALGRPLYMDRFTVGQQRLAFAKVCIEIDAKTEIPKVIDVILRDGTVGQIFVEIPWMPAKCTHCAIFGHGDKVYTQKPVKIQEHNKEEGKKESKQEETQHALKNDSEGGRRQSSKKDAVTTVSSPVTTVISSGFKSEKSGSSNRFDILNSTLDCEEEREEERKKVMVSRQIRAASAGVADLMKTLKPRGKGQGDKRKIKANASSEGHPTSL
ncbi:hypothetical protein DITRI_Ditri01bG0134500 [Diplodiscus trichospermus]